MSLVTNKNIQSIKNNRDHIRPLDIAYYYGVMDNQGYYVIIDNHLLELLKPHISRFNYESVKTLLANLDNKHLRHDGDWLAVLINDIGNIEYIYIIGETFKEVQDHAQWNDCEVHRPKHYHNALDVLLDPQRYF